MDVQSGLAKMLGARVVTTVGSEDKAAAVRALGADAVILRRTEDVAAKTEAAPSEPGRTSQSSLGFNAIGSAASSERKNAKNKRTTQIQKYPARSLATHVVVVITRSKPLGN